MSGQANLQRGPAITNALVAVKWPGGIPGAGWLSVRSAGRASRPPAPERDDDRASELSCQYIPRDLLVQIEARDQLLQPSHFHDTHPAGLLLPAVERDCESRRCALETPARPWRSKLRLAAQPPNRPTLARTGSRVRRAICPNRHPATTSIGHRVP